MLYRLISSALIVLIILLPIPFGGVLTWAWSAMCLTAGSLMILWGMATAFGMLPSPQPKKILLAACSLFIFVIAWSLLQTSSNLPTSLHHSLWKAGHLALGSTYEGSVTLDPVASREGILRLLSYGAVFLLTLQVAGRSRRRALLLFLIAAVISANAIFGLYAHLFDLNAVLWYRTNPVDARVSGTFVNANSFATYSGIGLVCLAGIFWQRLNRAVWDVTLYRERLRLTIVSALEHNWHLLVAGLVLIVALLLTQSRAGAGASLAALIVLVVVTSSRGPHPFRSAILTSTSLIVVFLLLFRLSGQELDVRLTDSGDNWTGRLDTYDTILSAVSTRPLTGTGAGTFESVFRLYGSAASTKTLAKAHNDYLELILELGIPAAMALLAAFALVVCSGISGLSRSTAYPAVGLSVSVLVGLHSLVDFSLQIPAIALIVAVILGIATAHSTDTFKR